MRSLSYIELPLTNDPRQVFTVDVTIDGMALHARIELRYLPAPDLWVISIWDHAASVLLVNQVPLICSYGELNDLLLPFRYIRDGAGVGSLFVLRNTDEPSSVNPTKENLTEFQILFGDTFIPEELLSIELYPGHSHLPLFPFHTKRSPSRCGIPHQPGAPSCQTWKIRPSQSQIPVGSKLPLQSSLTIVVYTFL